MIIQEIPIREIKIIENIRLPRDKGLEENLMRSIKDNGLLQPIGVKEETNGYTLIWGSRRLDACKKLGHKSIPAVIFAKIDEPMTEEEFFVINSTENLQRRNNSLLEVGRVIKILRKTMSVGEISVKLGLSKNTIRASMNEMYRIPKKWQKRIRIMNDNKEKAGDIPLTAANMVASLRGTNVQMRDTILESISKEGLNLDEIKLFANLLKQGYSKKEAFDNVKKYKVTTIKIFMDKDKLKNFMVQKGYESEIDFYIDAFNSFVKDPKFSFKYSVYKTNEMDRVKPKSKQ